MGRGGGPVISGHRAREGRDGEADRGLGGERDFQHCPVLGASGFGVLQAPRLCCRPRWDSWNGVLKETEEEKVVTLSGTGAGSGEFSQQLFQHLAEDSLSIILVKH